MAFHHYQSSGQPGWGTSQFRFGRPPTPGFQPQSSWGGYDYYRAHAATEDPYLFDHAWNRVREYGGAPGGMGVGMYEARHFHRRAYGANELHYMSPEEIGHAAAYEAYRTWIHNKYMYEPISSDFERQREALTGLAVAEASRLLSFSSRAMDQYARLTATEAAAHTASYIFYQTRNEEYRSRSQYRQGPLDDPYANDDDLLYPGARSQSRHRSYSRHRSRSRHRSYSQSGLQYPGSSYSPSLSVPQTPYHGSYAGSYPGSLSGANMPIQGAGSAYGPTGVPMLAGSNYGGMPTSPNPYAPPIHMGHSYQGVPPMGYSRSRSSSFSYSPSYGQYQPQYMQQPFMGTPMSAPSMGSMGVPTSPGSLVVIQQKPSRKHRRHRRSRSR